MSSTREGASSPDALGPRARPVRVDLRVLFPSTADSGRLSEGIDVDEVVGGGLWERVRTSGGEWLGVVTFLPAHRAGRSERHVAERQLVPANALRPR
jgi:hypothetical protein